ncbi:MAG: outer membrane protein assembly factor BamC [Gammaproteobacteria bacterium]
MRIPVGFVRAAALAAVLLGVVGCSWLKGAVSDNKVDYKSSGTVRSLEVPPDLTKPEQDAGMAMPSPTRPSSGTATYSDYTGARKAQPSASAQNAVLPEQPNVRVARDGDKYWLVIDATPAQVWPKIREFWLQHGFVLAVDNPTIGVMETDWAENRANIPEGPIRRFLGKALDFAYDTGTRDKFRVRIEHGLKPGTTELYLTHMGMEQVVENDAGVGSSTTVWQPRPEDHGLEVEMLRRIMVYLGVHKKEAKQEVAQAPSERGPGVRMVTEQGGAPALIIQQPFSDAWRITGLALDQIGFTVQDRDRAHGVYYVRYEDPYKQTERKKGFLSKLAFWRSDKKKQPTDEYQVFVQSQGDQTRVSVLNAKGKPDASGTGKRILTMLQEQLRR